MYSGCGCSRGEVCSCGRGGSCGRVGRLARVGSCGCAGCGGGLFETILDLGIVPLAGYFPTKEELSNQSQYPLNLVVCKYCKLVQTDSVIDPALLFEDYRYLSSVGLSGHFQNVAKIIDDHGGMIDLKSEFRRTEFLVLLPKLPNK